MKKQYLCSERAHFMCPNMHFGILATIKAKQNVKEIENCCAIMSKAHPFLRSIIKYDENNTKLYYKIEEESKIEINQRVSECTIWEDYNNIAENEWNVLHNGLLKMFIYPAKEGMRILFVAHHLLGDGRCLLELVNEFANLYVESIQPVYAPEILIQQIEDLPDKSQLTGVSKYLVRRLNKKWREAKTQVDYQTYAKLSEQFVKENPVSY